VCPVIRSSNLTDVDFKDDAALEAMAQGLSAHHTINPEQGDEEDVDEESESRVGFKGSRVGGAMKRRKLL
jgi:hypothetical protein